MPLKITLLIWRICCNGLLTTKNLRGRNILSHATGPHYGDINGDMIYGFKDCPTLILVFQEHGIDHIPSTPTQEDFIAWLQTNISLRKTELLQLYHSK